MEQSDRTRLVTASEIKYLKNTDFMEARNTSLFRNMS
jgi:hypothetical protein